MSKRILTIGEIVWDALPAGLFVGGAPFNVACHLHGLGATVDFVSRIGDDQLGRELIRRIAARGMRTEFIQTDDALPTGFVVIDLQQQENPSYEIVQPSAWDEIALNEELTARAAEADAVVFGTVAQRSVTSRATIRSLLSNSRFRIYDINLRPPFGDQELVAESLSLCDVAKFNEHELEQLRAWFDLPAGAEAAALTLADRFELKAVCVTFGGAGSGLLYDDEWHRHRGFKVDVVDAVGAGDAFLAALVMGLLAGDAPDEILALANAVGAWVATQSGATPAIDLVAVSGLIDSNG